MITYKLKELAKEDLKRIYRYGIKKFGLNQADKYYDKLFDHFDLIINNPYQFPSANHIKSNYRYCVCSPNTIYFKMKSETVLEIVRIIGRQDFKNNIDF